MKECKDNIVEKNVTQIEVFFSKLRSILKGETKTSLSFGKLGEALAQFTDLNDLFKKNEKILKKAIDLNKHEYVSFNNTYSVLEYAMVKHLSSSGIEFLLKKGADILRNDCGKNLINGVINNNNTYFLKFILKNYGQALLYKANQNQDKPFAELLIDQMLINNIKPLSNDLKEIITKEIITIKNNYDDNSDLGGDSADFID